jgi:hypothetical protein
MFGLAAASTYRSTGSPPDARSAMRTQRFIGFRPLTALPSGRCTSASAENPGRSIAKPRSTNASTVSPAQSAGTAPVRWNQLVPQAGPQTSKGSLGRYGAARASATSGGSPGACHTSTDRGAVAP